MPLTVTLGHSSLTGPRERNEDFCGAVTPEGADLENKGLIAAIADGVGGHSGGREAAEYAVRGLLADYYATPDTWSIPRSLDKVLAALNQWIIAEGGRDSALAGMATTLTGLVLRGRRYVCVHIGDTRLYLLRDGALTRLTQDHTWDLPELQNVLARAIGMDRRIEFDFSDGELAPSDTFLLCSDGVWGPLGEERLREVLLAQPDPQTAAAALASLALATGGHDNATALILRVESLPEIHFRDSLEGAARLPVPPLLRPGQVFDGWCVDEILHDSRTTRLYRVTDVDSGQRLVMKTLRPELADDVDEIRALLMEEWRARRVVSPYFAQVVPAERRSALYYLQTWHKGATLQALLDAGMHFGVGDVVQHGIALLRGLAVLHRLDIAHRDIKPANILVGQDGLLRILDLGVAVSRSEEDGGKSVVTGVPGTPSYMAPELLSGAPSSTAHDLYAAGVTLYHVLTRKYPYGEIEPFQHPKFGEPIAPTRYRPEIPGWLENILLKAVSKNPAWRFETAEEFLLALERGARHPVERQPRTPIALRDPVRTWRVVAAVSFVLNLLLLLYVSR